MGACLGSGVDEFSFQLWQDRQIRWDQGKNMVALRQGEVLLGTFEDVEDTKGDNGLGKLQMTNLRIIWTHNTTQRLNISIGIANVAYLHFNMADSKKFGRVRAPNLMTQFNQTRFEFTFCINSMHSNKLFNDLDSTIRRYRATRTYRDLILRDESLLSAGEVVILHEETLLKKIPNCDNLTTEEAFPGTMFITNLRMVWCARETPNINVSVPFIQTKHVGSRLSRFGQALVVETTSLSGGYILGFRFENTEAYQAVVDLMTKSYAEARQRPFFGPHEGSVQMVGDRLVLVPRTANAEPAPQLGDDSQPPGAASAPTPASRTSAPATAVQPAATAAVAGVEDAAAATVMLPDGAVQTRGQRQPSERNVNDGSPRSRSVRRNTQREPVPLDLRRASENVHPVSMDEGNLSPQSRKYMGGAPKCVICFTKRDEAAFDPCGHVCACMECAVKLNDCPICRTQILKVLRIYLTT